jgi:hypothetical protein
MRKGILFILLAAFFGNACNKNQASDAIVAQVGEKTLTWAELEDVIPNNSSPEDSINLSETYIKDWVREQVVLRQAEENLSDEQKNFDELIENYRKSLLTYSYEQELVRQKLDTNVNEEEIEKYYNDNIKNFELKDYIVKVKFCALSSDSKDLKQMKKLFYSTESGDLVKWEALCIEKQAAYYFDEDRWMLWEDLVQKIPLEIFDVESFLKKNKSIELERNGNTHFISFLDYQLSGSQSPLSFEREKIKDMIINKRKIELLTRMREDLYQQAMEKKEVEIFTNKK